VQRLLYYFSKQQGFKQSLHWHWQCNDDNIGLLTYDVPKIVGNTNYDNATNNAQGADKDYAALSNSNVYDGIYMLTIMMKMIWKTTI